MLIIVILHLIIQYIASYLIIYFRTQLNRLVGQLDVAKMSLSVIINKVNQAIILRTQDGSLGYSNENGIKFLKSIS